MADLPGEFRVFIDSLTEELLAQALLLVSEVG